MSCCPASHSQYQTFARSECHNGADSLFFDWARLAICQAIKPVWENATYAKYKEIEQQCKECEVHCGALAACIACPARLKTAFMLTCLRATLLMHMNTPHMATGLVALLSSTAVYAWPCQLHVLS